MSRRYGQHFLKDQSIVTRIVAESGIGVDDVVLEIGPGRGALTLELAKKSKKVIAVEIDRSLASELKSRTWPSEVEIVQGNILDFSEEELKKLVGNQYKIVTNLPYEITSEFFTKFLTVSPAPISITAMIQKEVGERLVAKGDIWSRLAVFCGYRALTKLLFYVSRGSFSPPPQVESCVVRLDLRPEPLLTVSQERLLSRLTEAAFAEKRKTLANSLKALLGPEASERLQSVGVDPQSRPERIPLAKWLLLASQL